MRKLVKGEGKTKFSALSFFFIFGPNDLQVNSSEVIPSEYLHRVRIYTTHTNHDNEKYPPGYTICEKGERWELDEDTQNLKKERPKDLIEPNII